MKQIIRTYKTKQNAEHVTEYRNVLSLILALQNEQQ